MDTPKKPPTSDEETTPPPAAPSLQARNPYRPLSRRRRQEQLVEPESQVERPTTTTVFDASPATVAAALAKAGASAAGPASLTWCRRTGSGPGGVESEPGAPEGDGRDAEAPVGDPDTDESDA